MKSPEEIEKALQRLMPPAMSGRGHAAVIESIERLAGSNESAVDVRPVQSHPPSSKNARWIRAAAAAVVLGAGLSFLRPATPLSSPLATAPISAASGTNAPIFIDRMLLTDAVTIEDTLAAADGSMMNQVVRRIQTRERYRDAKHGYLITVSESRDENVLIPKTSF